MATSAPAAASTDLFGWDLLFRSIQDDVNKKADVLVVLAHFILIKHYKMQCLGIGEDKTMTTDEVGTELLPLGWSDDAAKYALRYVNHGRLHLLLGHITEGFLTLNLLSVDDQKVSNITLNPDEEVKGMRCALQTMVPNAQFILDRYRKELVDPVFSGNTREVTTQTTLEQSRRTPSYSDPLQVGRPMRSVGETFFPPFGLPGRDNFGPPRLFGSGNRVNPLDPPPFGFPEIGRSDLDPLGRIGPGNLFPQPTHPMFGDMRPRYDPVSPNSRNVRDEPNPDHLPPPNPDFDYYM